nr:zinc finger, CCHC-type [Tanacetum cinerariifolium]
MIGPLNREKELSVVEQPNPPAHVADSEAQVLAEWNAVYDAQNEGACLMFGRTTICITWGRPLVNYMLYLLSMRKVYLRRLLHQMAIQGGKIQKANKKSLNAKGKDKGKGKEKDNSYIPKHKNHKPSTKEHPAKDDACHYYKEVGQWKRNCYAYLVELIKKNKQVGTVSEMIRKPFPHRTERATDLHGLIHTDVCGPLRHVSRQ